MSQYWRLADGRGAVAAETEAFRHAPGRRAGNTSRFFMWVVSTSWLGVLGWGLAASGRHVLASSLSLIPWIFVLMIVNLLPIGRSDSAYLAPDVPILVAAGLVLGWAETGLIGFLGAIDPKELRLQTSLPKALFNHTQASLMPALASVLVHAISRSPASSPYILLLAFVALISQTGGNYLFVGIVLSLQHGYSPRQILSAMTLGSAMDFTITLAAWGVLAAMLAALYDQVHPWALLAFLGPALLARQALARSQMFIDTKRAYIFRETALNEISQRIHDERLDERRLIAADLHDEVLQPLFKVNLMAHVLKSDLASGRLLEMDQDLPELLSAAEVASTTLRDLIGDLRRSALGRGGLSAALGGLVRALSEQTPIHLQARIDQIRADAATQLMIYQIAKEGLVNALEHSHADNISVELLQVRGLIFLRIEDDGVGFDPMGEREGHFGIHIMRERAAAAKAHLSLDSIPGRGARLSLSIEIQASEESLG